MSLKLFKLMLFLFMYIHLIACLWIMIIQVDNDWYPPTNWINIEVYDFFGESSLFKYALSFQYAVFMLIGGELGPRNTL